MYVVTEATGLYQTGSLESRDVARGGNKMTKPNVSQSHGLRILQLRSWSWTVKGLHFQH